MAQRWNVSPINANTTLIKTRKGWRMKKTLGYLFILLSLSMWGLVALLPFLELSRGEVATATTLLIIGGEVAFFIAIALLGKDFWLKIKSLFTTNK